jgi:outer membrane protein OmpA-like peptidoglycan-associated protein
MGINHSEHVGKISRNRCLSPKNRSKEQGAMSKDKTTGQYVQKNTVRSNLYSISRNVQYAQLHLRISLAFIIFHFTLFICSAQSTANEIETLLETSAITNAQAARFLLEASETMVTNDPQAAFFYAQEHKWLPKNASPDNAARLDAVSLLLMRSFGMKGGLMYSITKSPHFAYRELAYNNIIQGKSDPAMNVSGERLLLITGRILSGQEAQAALAAEKERQRLIALALAEEQERQKAEAEAERERQRLRDLEIARDQEVANASAAEQERQKTEAENERQRLRDLEITSDLEIAHDLEIAKANEIAQQNEATALAAEHERKILRAKELTRQHILFPADSAVLHESEKQKLEEIAGILKVIPGIKIHVIGHTARTGTLENEYELSHQRAQAVASHLVSLQALNASDITISGHGGDKPAANNATAEGMAANRRVEITILGN